jgi:two-component system, OmpR family, sensor kinase
VREIAVGRDTFTVAAVQGLHRDQEAIEMLRNGYLIAVPFLLMAAGVSGWLLARTSLAPIGAMRRRAEEISATNLHERLPVQNPGDELGRHAMIVNGLIERLDHAFEQQRRFMADASHELRTPVALLRAEADVTLSRTQRSETEYRDAFEVVHSGARRLSAIVDDIFLLARADAGRQLVERHAVQLDEIISDAARAVRSLAAQRSVRIEVGPLVDAPAVGDRELLGRLLLNLLDNAIKHSPSDSRVVMSLELAGSAQLVRVRDAGEGIPAEAQPHIFERFYRADRSRARAESSATSGAGLGLAIARWIAEEHGGWLELSRSDANGTEFCLMLPRDETAL